MPNEWDNHSTSWNSIKDQYTLQALKAQHSLLEDQSLSRQSLEEVQLLLEVCQFGSLYKVSNIAEYYSCPKVQKVPWPPEVAVAKAAANSLWGFASLRILICWGDAEEWHIGSKMSLSESERTWRLMKLREATQSNMHNSSGISAFDIRELTTLIYVRSHVRKF